MKVKSASKSVSRTNGWNHFFTHFLLAKPITFTGILTVVKRPFGLKATQRFCFSRQILVYPGPLENSRLPIRFR